MRIAAITAHDDGRRYTVTLQTIRGPLTAIYGPAHSGKTGVADLVGHALFGKRPARRREACRRTASSLSKIVGIGIGFGALKRITDRPGSRLRRSTDRR